MSLPKTHVEHLYDIWDQRWEGSGESERLTLLGRIMFRAKKELLKDLIQSLPVRTVIEVGCGLGHTMSVYRDQGLDVFGIDVSSHGIEVCRKKGLKVSLKRVEEAEGTYDLVSSDGMLEHFLHFEPFARHLMRISNRYVLLIQPNHDSFSGKTLAYLSELIRQDKNVYEYNYRVRDFISVFQTNGFEIIRNTPVFCDVFRLLLFERQSCQPPQSVIRGTA